MTTRSTVLVTSLAAAGLCLADCGRIPQSARVPDRREVARQLALQPLAFEPNLGQSASNVRFLSRAPGYSLYLTGPEAVVSFSGGEAPGRTRGGRGAGAGRSRASVRTRLVHANPSPRASGAGLLPGKSNYFLGSDPAGWRTGVPTYRKVRFEEVYPGIDLLYYGTQGNVEYDFVVRPSADPSRIRIAYSGGEPPRLDVNGDLLVSTGAGELVQKKPVAYQEKDGRRSQVSAAYRLTPRGEVTLALGDYDRRRTLVIDPVLSLGTYMGGTRIEGANSVAVAPDGAYYVCGSTESTDFPAIRSLQAHAGLIDAFVMRIEPRGFVSFASFLGGNSLDYGYSVATSPDGGVFLAGTTTSADFPLERAIQGARPGGTDGYLARLSSTGDSLEFSTYFGGRSQDHVYAVAADAAGYAYITGDTTSRDLPLRRPLRSRLWEIDAFLAKIDTQQSEILYSTYLGGRTLDMAVSVAVADDGTAFVAGETHSTDFPVANAVQSSNGGGVDAFLTAVLPAGNGYHYSTYFGGSGNEDTGGLAVDSSGGAVLVGSTNSTDLPAANALQPSAPGGIWDGFAARFTEDGADLVYSTYLGGSGADVLNGVALDAEGGASIVGGTESSNFPTSSPTQDALAGAGDACVSRLSPDGGTLLFSTFLGGADQDWANGVAVDAEGCLLVVGETSSEDFPVTGFFQSTLAELSDAFFVEYSVEPAAPTGLAATAVSSGAIYLSWNDNSGTEGGFLIERRAGTAAFQEVKLLPADTTDYLDGNLSPSTAYTYRVRAYACRAISAPTSEVSATTLAAVGRPTGLAGSPLSATEIRVTWTDNSNNEIGFELQRKPPNGAFRRIALLKAAAASYNDTGLNPGTKYFYRVRAYTSTSHSRWSNQARAKTRSAPEPPSHLIASVLNASQIEIKWIDRSSTEQGFRIERSSAGPWTEVATVAANVITFRDSNLTPSRTYTYRVRSYSGAYRSDPSNDAEATTQAAPPAPSNLTVTGVTTTSVALSWRDNSATETGFQLERSTDGTNFTVLTTKAAASGSGSTVTHTDNTVTAGTTYHYRVRAVSGTYVSAPSNTVTANP